MLAGLVAVPLVGYVQSSRGKTVLTPHTVTVSLDGKATGQDVTLDRPRTLKLAPLQ